MSDWYLLFLYYESNNEIAYLYLWQKYEWAINYMANWYNNKFSVTPFEKNDLINLGYFFFYQLLYCFQTKSKMSFRTFVLKSLQWQYCNYLKKFINKKQEIINRAIIINEKQFYLKTHVYSFNDFSVKEKFCFNEVCLSQTETKVWKLRIKGKSYQEIMELLQLTYKQVDNACYRVHKKLQQRKKK